MHSGLFQSLLNRGLKTPLLVVSNAKKGLIAAIRESFPGASLQRCKVHFLRNILTHVTRKEKESRAFQLKIRGCGQKVGLNTLRKEIEDVFRGTISQSPGGL
jgi:transposase-like protein